MDEHSLARLEFPRVTAAVAARAASATGAAMAAAMRPIADPAARRAENRLMDEALRRHREPGEWCRVGPGVLADLLEARPDDGRPGLDGPGLIEVLEWLNAAAATRAAWSATGARERFPGLAGLADALPTLEGLRERLATALEPDGRVADGASPILRRARAALARGERDLQERLERWVRPFGDGAHVTRNGDRFVALVPAAGFPRRRGVVHDVSGSGQSLYVEPLEACETNNRLIELRAAAQGEERRILAELADGVRTAAGELAGLERLLAHLDTLRARAIWAAETGGAALDPGGERLHLEGARHPLLVMGDRREDVVALDLDLGPGARLLLVSGPNMGGKTVLLKTVGLAVTLAHAGIPVPAREGSAIPEVEAVLVDLGDEQSLDEGLSTFAAHLRSLAAMAEQASPRALLLCDELGAGTDPEEGAALGRALIERFAARGAWAVVTTHLGGLKRVAADVEGVVNGSLEFDARTMSPCYRFLPGIPGASHALAMAERLGLDAQVIARARAITPDETRAVERLLHELQDWRRRLAREEAALGDARERAERAAAESHEAAEEARRTLEGLRRRLTGESEALLARARELWQTVQREARRSEKTRAGAARVREQVEAVEAEATALRERAAAARRGFGAAEPDAGIRPIDPRTLAPGDRVRIVDLGVEAEVVSGPDGEGKVLLRRGSWSIRARIDRLAVACGVAASRERDRPPSGGSAAVWERSEEAPPLEVDLRGLEVDEALRSLDLGLDRGVLDGLSELRVVHGIGKGVLRGAVERHLRNHPQVVGQRAGQVGEGGRGVTIARLR